jgi:hypothetical protein
VKAFREDILASKHHRIGKKQLYLIGQKRGKLQLGHKACHESLSQCSVQVCQWFASRSDVILMLFDPHKLDISDEFKEVITAMKGNEEKIRVCLNKADSVDQQQLLRVHGALMWSLGKVIRNPEVVRYALYPHQQSL